MDGNKPATAPSMTWNRENPYMFQSRSPPAYQDSSYPGSANSAQPQGYGFPQTSGSRFDQQPYRQPYGQPFQQPNQHLNQQPYSVNHGRPVQPGVFTVQPPAYNRQASPVNDYLGYSIFTMLCCCLPLGIAALVNSISTRNANTSGDSVAAERSSKQARILNHVSLGFGLLIYLIMIIMVAISLT